MLEGRTNHFWRIKAKKLILRSTGGRVVLSADGLKHGFLDTEDIARFCEVKTILDVGANVGQSAIRFRVAFPDARIVSLEPVQMTYQKLVRSTRRLRVECHQLALGHENGSQVMYLTDVSLTNSLNRPDDDCGFRREEVAVETLDSFVQKHSLGVIDLLKIDAEGWDLHVLEGGRSTLSSGRVKFVIAEVGFNPGVNGRVLFDDVRALLGDYDFRLFGFYEQTLEWSGQPSLRFANAVFCNQGAVPLTRL